MGLDGVELLLSIEEAFGIAIADPEAEACATPGAVIDLVLGKLRTTDEQVCVSQRAFYLLRKGLTRTLGVSRRQLDLGTDIRAFVAGRSEREVWRDLRNAVQARRWPALARPTWLTASIVLLSLGTFCSLIASVHGFLAGAAAVLVAFVAARLTRPLRSRIPARRSRLRTLVPFAATSDSISWTRDQVATRVRKLVIEHLELREGQYREDAHFLRELGL